MTILNPNDPPERREAKLVRIAESLMRRVEQVQNDDASSYAQFQRAVMLEEQVRQRTRDLEATLDLLNRSNAELAHTMEAEKRARDDLSNALEAVQDGFALFGGDGRMIMFNSRFCQSLPDVRAGLYVGVDIDDYFDLVSQSKHLDRAASGEPQDWAQWRRRQRRAPHATFNVKLTDGSFFQVSEHPTPDGGAAILQTDVTKMIGVERAERARLLDNQARLARATLDHINQGVVIFDRDQHLAGWNKKLADLLTPPVRLVRIGARFRTLLDAIAADARFLGRVDAAAVVDWVEHRQTRPPLSFEISRGDAVLAGFAQVMPDGGFVMSFADVTLERNATAALHDANEALERRVAERTRDLETALDEAVRANASKSRFVAATSHDLLQPLSAAKLFVASVGSMEMAEPARQAMRRAGAALESVETILDELLEISKLDSGRAVMRPERMLVSTLLLRLIDEFQPEAAAKGLQLTIRGADLEIVSDPTYFRRIMQNLISNALRYTERGGVLVGVRRRGGAARIEVWDTGPGIPADRQDEIFEEFNRLDATVNAADGLGLGLSIVDRAARALGHTVSLRSTLGSGSCFAIEAPLATTGAAAAEPATPPKARSGESPLVLIVVGDAARRANLNALLESWGVLTLDAPTESEAISLLMEADVLPDAIVVDCVAARASAGLARLGRASNAAPTALITPDQSIALDRLCRDRSWTLMRAPINATAMLEFLASAAPDGDAATDGRRLAP